MEKNWLQKQYEDMTPEEQELYRWLMYEEELKIRKHEREVRQNWNPFE